MASAKMSRTFGFSDMIGFGDDDELRGVASEYDVSIGESICIGRFARGELGSPLGDSGG